MQNGKKKNKPLNLIKGAFNNQSPQTDPDVEDSQIGEPNRKPVKTVGGSLNLITEAFTQEKQEEDIQTGPLTRKPVKTVGGSLNLIAEAFTQENQGEEDTQTGELQGRTVRK